MAARIYLPSNQIERVKYRKEVKESDVFYVLTSYAHFSFTFVTAACSFHQPLGGIRHSLINYTPGAALAMDQVS